MFLYETATTVTNDYDEKLVWFWYDQKLRTAIIEEGMADLEKELKNLEDKGGNQYVIAEMPQEDRHRKRLAEKAVWYKG